MTPPSALLFTALSDRTRRAIYEHLSRGGEQTVRTLTAASGVSQPAISRHLGILDRAGLVHRRRAGCHTHYRAAADGLAPLVDWLNLYGAFWRERFDRLEVLLKRLDQ
ncbi:MAG: ArsR/SmtB family transcription factor [Acetobacteraceae bacterium]